MSSGNDRTQEPVLASILAAKDMACIFTGAQITTEPSFSLDENVVRDRHGSTARAVCEAINFARARDGAAGVLVHYWTDNPLERRIAPADAAKWLRQYVTELLQTFGGGGRDRLRLTGCESLVADPYLFVVDILHVDGTIHPQK